MKDLKTTLAGLGIGLSVAINALMEAYTAGLFTGKTGLQLIASICLVLLGLFASDSKQAALPVQAVVPTVEETPPPTETLNSNQ